MKPVKNILITLGDPAGISGEVIVSALAKLARPTSALAKQIRALLVERPANLYVAGDGQVLAHAKRIVRATIPVEVVDGFAASCRRPRASRSSSSAGSPSRDFASASRRMAASSSTTSISPSRRRGAELVAAIVTAPMTKEAVAKVEPGFVGHTGYLAEELGVHDERMAFLTPDYILALQTTHIPLADVAKNLTQQGIATTIAMLAAAGRKYYGRKLPVAVLGLNPHAGEHGLLGLEEDRIIVPAMERARGAGWACDGPFPADSFFIARVKRYKLIVAMYHDQGLVAVKPAFPRVSVNVTLGLPVVRTSVDHGSGYDIAGKGKADETSMLHAIKAALELTRT